jgi:hypothetical protein
MARQRRQRRAPQNPMGRPPNMNQMMNTMANMTLGTVAIGGMTSLGIGAMNAIKPP